MNSDTQQMNQRFVDQFNNEQQKVKNVKQRLQQDCETLNRRIQRQLQKIDQICGIIKDGSKLQTNIYKQSLDPKIKSLSVVNIQILSNYLKQQKKYLSEVVKQEEDDSNKSISGKQLLHRLSNRKKVQNYLNHLQLLKLQYQIDYIQKNILLNSKTNKSSTVVYEDIEGMTVKQQKQLNQKILRGLQQLQRVVNLSNECGGNKNVNLNEKINLLKEQTQRLQQVEQILQSQTKQIVQVKNFFKDYQAKEILNYLNLINQNYSHSHCNLNTNSQQFIFNWNIQNEQDMNALLNYDQKDGKNKKMTIFKKPFEQVFDTLKMHKNKLKKIKI